MYFHVAGNTPKRTRPKSDAVRLTSMFAVRLVLVPGSPGDLLPARRAGRRHLDRIQVI